MNQQQALIKLAQVRLAINHVLRTRAMQKQAEDNPYEVPNALSPEQVESFRVPGTNFYRKPNTPYRESRLPLMNPHMAEEWKNYFARPIDSLTPVPTETGKYFRYDHVPGASYLTYNPYLPHDYQPEEYPNLIYPPADDKHKVDPFAFDETDEFYQRFYPEWHRNRNAK